MARLTKESLHLGDFPTYVHNEDREERNRKLEEYAALMGDLIAVSDALPEGEILGGVVSFGVADGSAAYLVVKERPLTLQHIDFMDGYRVHYALIKGLDREDILFELGHSRKLRKLFTGSQPDA